VGQTLVQPGLKPSPAGCCTTRTWSPAVVTLPLKARHVVGTGDRAIAAADAFLGGPAHDARLGIFVQRLERTPSRAGGIETVHALPLHERGRRAILRFVELDNVAGEIVEVVGRLMQRVPARIGRRIVGFGAGRLAGFATDANAGVVEQSDRGAGDRIFSVSACNDGAPMLTATAAGTPVLAMVEISSRRVMSTSVLFLSIGFPDDALSFSAWHDQWPLVPRRPPGCSGSAAKRPRRAPNGAGHRAHQSRRAHLDASRAAVNGWISIGRSRKMYGTVSNVPMLHTTPFSVHPTQGMPSPIGQQSAISLKWRVEQEAWVTGPLQPIL